MRMELPQSRPFGTEGKKPTHDFLSLYNHSSFQHQDPRPSQGNCLKTRDFLQPLETVGKNNSSSSKEESSLMDKSNTVERPVGPPTQPRPPSSSSSSSIEHILPGGIGTYTINHISDFNHLVPPKPERSPPTVVPACNSEKKVQVKNDMSNSNSSYSGSSFTLWGDSVVETGTTITKKSNTAIREPAENLGSWSSEQPLPPPPNYIIPTTFNSLPSSKETGQKNLSFMEMMKSGKTLHEEDDDEEEFPSKKDIPSQKELRVKVDGKSNDQKANTPRSKHSATEQRRRSKINDRFQILRDLLPLNDQKRDKASFLLEVIEYIQFLQEKVNKYEGPYQGWNQEPTKLMPWRNRHGPGESIADHSRGIKNVPGPGLIFGGKSTDINVSIHPPILPNSAENDQKPGATYKPDLRFSNKVIPATVPMQPDMFIPSGSCDLTQPMERPISDGENLASKSESHLWQSRTCTTSGALNGQDERAIHGGTIRISNVYSQELLNNLTKALESSGVDLSLATISVQVDLGKQPVGSLTTTMDHTNPSKTMGRPRSGEDSDQAQKRLKTEKS